MHSQAVKQNHFFIEPDDCVTCGCCEGEAPSVFKVDDDGSALIKQPETPEEFEQVVSAMRVCMTACIYYRGLDSRLIERMKKIGVEPHQIVQSNKV